jgi:IS1 family transposase
MLNARKGISAMQIQRNLGVTYKSAWYSAMRVRCAMIEEIGQNLLEGILEMDEAYLGGKPRKRLVHRKGKIAYLSNLTVKRGRGTKKIPVVGIVEREGKKRVVMEIPERLNTQTMLALLKKYVNTEKSIMMTDEAKFYKKFEEHLQHLIVTHSKGEYTKGIISTNRIENVWSIIKNGIRGEYHVLSRKYLPFYLAEWAYKYNRRFKQKEAFDETMKRAVGDEKCLVKYKPKKSPDEFAYGKKVRKTHPTNRRNKRRKYKKVKSFRSKRKN